MAKSNPTLHPLKDDEERLSIMLKAWTTRCAFISCRRWLKTTKPSCHYFDPVAGMWDSLSSGFFTEEVRKSAIAKAYLRPELVVADVGGRTGFVS